MLLCELQAGADIELEVVAGNKKFEIPLKVERTEQFSILTDTFRYGGNVVDFSKKGFEHLLFNIYASDVKNQGRFVWKGVSMHVVSKSGIPYYKFEPKNVLMQGTSINRRGEKRLMVNVEGKAFSPDTGVTSRVLICDVSNHGISICAPSGFAGMNDIMDLRFRDIVNDKDFDLAIEIQCVRVVPKDDNDVIFGCKVRNSGRDYQTYVYFKRLIEEKIERQMFFGN